MNQLLEHLPFVNHFRLLSSRLLFNRAFSMNVPSTSNFHSIQRVERNLDSPNDIYMAKYDPELKVCIPINDPYCSSDVKDFLSLPYQNAVRYSRIFRLLKQTSGADTFSFVDLTRGIQSYVGRNIEFDGLRAFIDQLSNDDRFHFNDLIKFMASLALELNKQNFERIPLLHSKSSNSLSLSQRQAAILLANGFFCTFEDSMKRRRGTYNTFSFLNLFSLQTFKCTEKLKCIFAYFQTIQENMPQGMITILRETCPRIRFEDINPSLIDVKVELEGFIEEQLNEAHVDFANSRIGGGVLTHGAVQEEIRFITAPETLIACLLCEKMHDSECILILGTQQYSNYKGYRNSFKFVSKRPLNDHNSRTPFGHYSSWIIAMDAISYDQPERQFLRRAIDREIRKAFIGFSVKLPYESQTIATGNWGCGAFKGNLELKFLIQFIAASATGRNLHYFAFGEKKFVNKITNFLQLLKDQNISFETIYGCLIEGGSRPSGDLIMNPFEYILEHTQTYTPKSRNDAIEVDTQKHSGTLKQSTLHDFWSKK